MPPLVITRFGNAELKQSTNQNKWIATNLLTQILAMTEKVGESLPYPVIARLAFGKAKQSTKQIKNGLLRCTRIARAPPNDEY